MEERFRRNVRGIIINREFGKIKWSVEANSMMPDDMCYFKVVATYEGELVAEACVRIVRAMPRTPTKHLHEWDKFGIVDWLYIPEAFERMGLEHKVLEQLHEVVRLYQLKSLLLTRTKEELKPKQKNDLMLDEKTLSKSGYRIYRVTNEDTAFLRKLKY